MGKSVTGELEKRVCVGLWQNVVTVNGSIVHVSGVLRLARLQVNPFAAIRLESFLWFPDERVSPGMSGVVLLVRSYCRSDAVDGRLRSIPIPAYARFASSELLQVRECLS